MLFLFADFTYYTQTSHIPSADLSHLTLRLFISFLQSCHILPTDFLYRTFRLVTPYLKIFYILYLQTYHIQPTDFSYPTCRLVWSNLQTCHILPSDLSDWSQPALGLVTSNLQTFHVLPANFSYPALEFFSSHLQTFHILPADFLHPTFFSVSNLTSSREDLPLSSSLLPHLPSFHRPTVVVTILNPLGWLGLANLFYRQQLQHACTVGYHNSCAYTNHVSNRQLDASISWSSVNRGNSVYLSMQNRGGAFTFFNNSAKSPPGRAEPGANHLQLGTTSVDLSQPPPGVVQATPRSNTDQLVTSPPLTRAPVANLATPLSLHTAAVAPTPTTTQERATTRATTKKRKLQTPPCGTIYLSFKRLFSCFLNKRNNLSVEEIDMCFFGLHQLL